MSETDGVPNPAADPNEATLRPDGAAPEASAEPIPDHLTDAALDGHQIKRLAQERIDEMQAEIDAAKEQSLRLAAELENTRRRAERERQEASRYAVTGFARDLLSVADNMAKAIELAPEDPAAMSAEGLAGLVNGMRMTERELLAVFERNGITRIDPQGQAFDPNVHQAIAQVPGGGLPKDTVADVAAVGFVIGDRVVRPAMVTVSTGAEHVPGQDESESGGGEAAGDAA